MATKTLTITEDAYYNLKKVKGEDESFSKLFLRLTKSNLFVKDLQGKLSGFGNAKAFQQRLRKIRMKANKEAKERYARLR